MDQHISLINSISVSQKHGLLFWEYRTTIAVNELDGLITDDFTLDTAFTLTLYCQTAALLNMITKNNL